MKRLFLAGVLGLSMVVASGCMGAANKCTCSENCTCKAGECKCSGNNRCCPECTCEKK